MKIFRCLRTPLQAFADHPGFLLYPDSAVIRDGKPFFVPSFSSGWTWCIGPAWRVCRLGKTIGARFAGRYYDAVTLCMFPCPDDLPAGYGAVATTFDGAVILGSWLPLPEEGASLVCTVDGVTIDFGPDGSSLSETIPWISRYCTLKIGDVIVSSVADIGFDIPIDSHIVASLNGRTCLDFRIK